jgi:CDP-diglyceride synthetase
MNKTKEGFIIGIAISVIIIMGTFSLCSQSGSGCGENPIQIFAIFGSMIVIFISGAIGSLIKTKQ